MSTLVTKTIQLGDSGTLANNFLIKVPAVPDGTLLIERMDGTDVLTIDASGQIQFPGGFESGSWIPVLRGFTTAGVGTYTVQEGYYQKIGKLVFVRARVDWTAHTGTGEMRFNLPFTPDIFPITALITYSNGLNAGASNIPTCVIVATTIGTEIRIQGISTSGAGASIPNMDTAGSVIFSGWYLSV